MVLHDVPVGATAVGIPARLILRQRARVRMCAKIDGRGDGISEAVPRQLGGQSALPSSMLAVGSFGCINYFQGALPELHVAIMNEMHVGLIFATIIRSTEIKGVYIRHGFVT